MKTATFDVGYLASILDFAAIEKRLSAFPGVAAVNMNAASTSASVTFDDARTNAESVAREIETCGFHCRGEIVPRHLCAPDGTTVPMGHGHGSSVREAPEHSAHADHDHAAPDAIVRPA